MRFACLALNTESLARDWNIAVQELQAAPGGVDGYRLSHKGPAAL